MEHFQSFSRSTLGRDETGTSRDIMDMSGLTRSTLGREDGGTSRDLMSLARGSLGRDDEMVGRDVAQRPRDVQRALEVLGSLEAESQSGK